MVFNILITLNNIESGNRKYSLAIGDTMIVESSGGVICTKLSKRQLGNISVRVDESSDESEGSVEEEHVVDSDSSNGGVSLIRESRNGGRSRNRAAPKREITEDSSIKRKLHQTELGKKLHENSMKRYLKQDANSKSDSTENKDMNKQTFVCYSSVREIPRERDVVEMKIHVDKLHDCVLLPILGIMVPFHISTFKVFFFVYFLQFQNINTSLESDYMYLRINFIQPIPV